MWLSIDKTLVCNHLNQVKVIERYFRVVVPCCKSLWMKHCVTIQMKAIEQYFHVVLFIMLYKVVLHFSPWMIP